MACRKTRFTTLARTPDGYLWLGTAEGLVRFDGVRFTVFDVGNTPALGNSRVDVCCSPTTPGRSGSARRAAD